MFAYTYPTTSQPSYPMPTLQQYPQQPYPQQIPPPPQPLQITQTQQLELLANPPPRPM